VDLTTNADGERTGVNASGVVALDDAGAPRVVYANEFPLPWGWRVSSYFLTKATSAGIAIAAAVALLFGSAMESMWMRLTGPLVGGLLLLLTGLLLVADLKRPDRFYYLLTRGNPSSWLVRGAWILTAQAVGFAVWFLAALGGNSDLARTAIWFSAFVGLGTAGYTAYLFAQAKGRVMWGNPLLVWHMVAAAFAVGGGVSLIASLVSTTGGSTGIGVSEAPLTTASVPTGTFAFALTMVLGSLVLGLIAALESEEPKDPGAALAHRHMTTGEFANRYRVGLVLGVVLPVATGVAVIFGAPVVVGAIGGLSAMVGVWLLDDAFVQAGQSVPLT
jgi:formate-dependent nitrite reductase membrane component NrfD